MTVKIINNINDYVLLTTKLKNDIISEDVPLEQNLAVLKNTGNFELQFYQMYNECGAAFIYLTELLNHKDFLVTSAENYKDLLLMLRYWLQTASKDIIEKKTDNWWTFIQELLCFIQRFCLRYDIRDKLLKAVSKYLLELSTCGVFNIFQINKILKTVNKCTCCPKELRLHMLEQYNEYFIKIAQIIANCGHADTQITAMETLMRFLVKRSSIECRKHYAGLWFKPPTYPEEVIQEFINNNPSEDVFGAMRRFLIHYNNYTGNIFSVLCMKVTFGKVRINGYVWVDFNILHECMSISISVETLRLLGMTNAYIPEMLQISAQDTEKIESNENAAIVINTKAGPRFLYESSNLLDILDEDAKMISFELYDRNQLSLLEKYIKHIFGYKYYRCSSSILHDEGTRNTVSNSDDDSRSKFRKGLLRTSYASISTKQSKIPCSIALMKSKEVTQLSTTIETNLPPTKKINNNDSVLDHISMNSYDFRKLSADKTNTNINQVQSGNLPNDCVYDVDSCAPRGTQYKPPDETVVDQIICESLSKDAYSETFVAPPVKIHRKKQNKLKPIPEEFPTIEVVPDIVVPEEKVNNIPENVLTESLSRRADSDLVREHFCSKNYNNSVTEIVIVTNENNNEFTDKENDIQIVNEIHPIDSHGKESTKQSKPQESDTENKNENLINSTLLSKRKATTKDRKKKTEKSKLLKTIKNTKPPIQKDTRKSTRLTKRKLYTENLELIEDNNILNTSTRKSFINGGSCYKEILRDREKHKARKSINTKPVISPPLSPREIKRNELFDKLRADVATNENPAKDRDIAFFNFTSDEDDDFVNLRSDMYSAQHKKSPEEPKKQSKKSNKAKKRGNNKVDKSKNKVDEIVEVNIIESQDEIVQDLIMREAPKEDNLNTSLIIEQDEPDDLYMTTLIPKHHMNPIVKITDKENDLTLNKTENNGKSSTKEIVKEGVKIKRNSRNSESVTKEKKEYSDNDTKIVILDRNMEVEQIDNEIIIKQKTQKNNKTNNRKRPATKKNVVTKKTKTQKSKSPNITHSSSPLPDLIIEPNVPEKSNNASIESIKMLENIKTARNIIEPDKEILKIGRNFDYNSIEIQNDLIAHDDTLSKEVVINTEDKEIMPPPSNISVKPRKRSSKTQNFTKDSKRVKPHSDFDIEIYKSDTDCTVVSEINEIQTDKITCKKIKKEMAAKTTSDFHKNIDKSIEELLEIINNRFDYLIEKTEQNLNANKQMIVDTVNERFKVMEEEFRESLKPEKDRILHFLLEIFRQKHSL